MTRLACLANQLRSRGAAARSDAGARSAAIQSITVVRIAGTAAARTASISPSAIRVAIGIVIQSSLAALIQKEGHGARFGCVAM